MEIEPFRLEPQLKERVWGGSRLGVHEPPFGEAWIAGEQNLIVSGSLAGLTLAAAVSAHPDALLGQPVAAREGAVFPLLIKLLDPRDWLSIQVHPDDALAAELEGPGFRGKTEAWYVLEAEPGSQLIAGVAPDIAREQVSGAIREGTLDPFLERHVVHAGDALLVEAGVIHALGPGLFIYEVQQSSDLTYRVSDWGRPASAGRQLHIEQSVRAAKPDLRPRFAPMVKRPPNGSFSVLACRYFELELVDSDGVSVERDTGGRSFEAITIVSGKTEVVTGSSRLVLDPLASGIVPASIGRYRFRSGSAFRALVAKVPAEVET